MRRKIIAIGALFICALGLAGYSDYSDYKQEKECLVIKKQEIGERQQEIDLQLSADDLMSNYDYTVTVDSVKPDKEEAMAYINMAKSEIDESLCGQQLTSRKTNVADIN